MVYLCKSASNQKLSIEMFPGGYKITQQFFGEGPDKNSVAEYWTLS